MVSDGISRESDKGGNQPSNEREAEQEERRQRSDGPLFIWVATERCCPQTGRVFPINQGKGDSSSGEAPWSGGSNMW